MSEIRNRRNREIESVEEVTRTPRAAANPLAGLFQQSLAVTAEEASQGDFELLPEGEYVCEIDSVEFATSKAGNPMIKYVLNIIEGDYIGRKIWKFVMLTKYNTGEADTKALAAESIFLYELAGAERSNDSTIEEFTDIMADITANKDQVVATLKNWTSKNGNTGQNTTLEIY